MNRTFRFFIFAGIVLFSMNYALAAPGEEPEFRPSLASFVISPTEAAPGDSIQCRFIFSNGGDAPSSMEEKIFLHFTDPIQQSEIRWQFDHNPPVSTKFWMKDQEIVDGPLSVAVPDEIADGSYAIRVGLWNPVTGLRSLDVILPTVLIVDKTVSPPPREPIQSISWIEANRRDRILMLQRFVANSPVQIENQSLSFQIEPKSGLFCIQEFNAGAIWQSAPGAGSLGYVMAENEKQEAFRFPLNQLTVLSQSKKKCVLQKRIGESTLVELQISAEKNDPVIRFSWEAGENWTLHHIEWTGLLWTTDALGGGAVIPRLIGEFFPANHPLEFQQIFSTYGGWGGLHIPMAAMLREQSNALLSWNSPDISVNIQSLLQTDENFPGAKQTSIDLQSAEPSGEFFLRVGKGNSYVDAAQSYREMARKDGLLVSLEQKARKSREVKKLAGAAEFKPFVCIRFQEQDGAAAERVVNSYTEEDCIELARHLHDDLNLNKVLFVLAGWIHRGYDNQHPDILPAAPEIGGNEGVARISETVRSFGYLFGLHDNYQDMYEDAPSWNEDMLIVEKDGRCKKGGVWAGGQAWLIASDHGLELAHRNLPEIKKLFSPNAYFIDTTYAAPLYESFQSGDRMTRIDDLQFKRELSRYAAGMFGVHGSETGFAFGVPVSHYFEGILSTHDFIKDFPNPGAEEIPLFPLIFHDCVAMYTHQGDRAGLGDARKILKHLVLGEMPLYNIPPHQYWRREMKEPDLNDPDYCFARINDGWGAGKHPVDRFIKNTYEFLSPFAEAVAAEPMTDHQFLREDRSVEMSRFGEHWQVIVNYGPGDYQFAQTLLPPMGFIVLGPDFLAQHFYPQYGEARTSLVVKRDGKTFTGF
ncbi:MAG: hypothetical protein JXR73_00585 [Candidatus Omnitrophica bacterium]|nr:hypothetical protein [Candidatus Omnitrophota bacterium]